MAGSVATAAIAQLEKDIEAWLNKVGAGDVTAAAALSAVEDGCTTIDTAVASLELDTLAQLDGDVLGSVQAETLQLREELARKDQLVENQRQLLVGWRERLAELRQATPTLT
eukprot:m.188282 g.188282  ORF g.188282 m.188282 type:complete len:112 (-) comp24819_c0_seq1:250-585(-)